MVAMIGLRTSGKHDSSIYLAGKVNGPKWDLVRGIRDVKFKSSDSGKHSNHCWGGGTGFDDFNSELMEEVIRLINESVGVLAYVTTPDSFGTIAEVTWAARSYKPTHLIVEAPNPYDGYGDDWPNHHELSPKERDEIDVWYQMADAYWFVSAIPGVTKHVTSCFEESRLLAKAITEELLGEST